MNSSRHLFSTVPLPILAIPPSFIAIHLAGQAFSPNALFPWWPSTYRIQHTPPSFSQSFFNIYAERALRFAIPFIHACYVRAKAVKLSQPATSYIPVKCFYFSPISLLFYMLVLSILFLWAAYLSDAQRIFLGRLSVYLSVYLSICPFVHLFICPSVRFRYHHSRCASNPTVGCRDHTICWPGLGGCIAFHFASIHWEREEEEEE